MGQPGMPERLSLEIPAQTAAMETLLDAVDSFGKTHDWSEVAAFHVRMVLEEILMNVIMHGGDGTREPSVWLDLEQQAQGVLLTVQDDGVAFDPTLVAPPDIEASLEERDIGGLGVHLMHTLMDHVSYCHANGRNCLRLQKSVA